MTIQPTGYRQLPQLLQTCEDLFTNASPATRHELDALLRERGITGGPSWLVDLLAFARLTLLRGYTMNTSSRATRRAACGEAHITDRTGTPHVG